MLSYVTYTNCLTDCDEDAHGNINTSIDPHTRRKVIAKKKEREREKLLELMLR